MDRLISEQAVLEVITKEFIPNYAPNDDLAIALNDSLEQILNNIKAIPSAEPTYYPPCEDCHTKMNEIRKAYDKVSAYKGMTNGEVIKTIFPNAKITEKSERFPDYPYVDVFFIDEYDMNCFPRDWWNSPYSEGSDKE